MRYFLSLTTAILIIAPTAVLGSTRTFEILASETFDFTNVQSWDPLGDPDNEIIFENATGGFVANQVVVSGSLTEYDPITYASEADIYISTSSGEVAANGATVADYDSFLDTFDTVTPIDYPFDPNGFIDFEFYESFDDAPDDIDQVWNSVSITLRETLTTIENESFNIGQLPADGRITRSLNHSHVATGLDFFEFSIDGSGSWLNIQTFDARTGDTIDTELAIFDANGVFMATDDDGQGTQGGTQYSLLSFGDDDPLSRTDTDAGADGMVPLGGTYTAVTAGFDTNFEDLIEGLSTIDEVIGGGSEGDYHIQFAYGGGVVDSPSGDFDNDNDYDCDDIDALVSDIAAGNHSADFDLNGDGNVDQADLSAWLAEAGQANIGAAYLAGDGNLDGVVDVSDFNVWNSSKFQASAAWCLGDYNADGFSDVSDFNIWNGNKFTASDAAAVPEPSAAWLALVIPFILLPARKRVS